MLEIRTNNQKARGKKKMETDHQVIQNLMTINMGIKTTSAIRYKKTLEKIYFFTKTEIFEK